MHTNQYGRMANVGTQRHHNSAFPLSKYVANVLDLHCLKYEYRGQLSNRLLLWFVAAGKRQDREKAGCRSFSNEPYCSSHLLNNLCVASK